MKLLDLAAIRARCDAATPGPWTYDEEAGYVDIGLPRYRSIAIGIEMDATTKSDGDFIARARADVPALLAYVHDLEQELAENDRLRIANAEERALTAEERLEQMTHERDEARAQLAAIGAGSPCDGHRHCCADRRKLAEELLRVRAERDEARLKAQHLERHLEIWETPYCACGRRLTDCDGSRARCLGSQSGSLGINEDAKRR